MINYADLRVYTTTAPTRHQTTDAMCIVTYLQPAMCSETHTFKFALDGHESKTYVHALNIFISAVRDLLIYAQQKLAAAVIALLLYANEHPYLFTMFVLLTAAGFFSLIAPAVLGFGAAGPVAGELHGLRCTR